LGYRVTMTAGAKDFLAGVGYEPHYGVRSLRRALLEHVEEPFAERIVAGEPAGGALTVGLNRAKNGLEIKACSPSGKKEAVKNNRG
jgi:ATP-dependent Clp protease ATP-binding subunit ClpC